MRGMRAEVWTPAPCCLLTGLEAVHVGASAAHAGGMACAEILGGKRPRRLRGSTHQHPIGPRSRVKSERTNATSDPRQRGGQVLSLALYSRAQRSSGHTVCPRQTQQTPGWDGRPTAHRVTEGADTLCSTKGCPPASNQRTMSRPRRLPESLDFPGLCFAGEGTGPPVQARGSVLLPQTRRGPGLPLKPNPWLSRGSAVSPAPEGREVAKIREGEVWNVPAPLAHFNSTTPGSQQWSRGPGIATQR